MGNVGFCRSTWKGYMRGRDYRGCPQRRWQLSWDITNEEVAGWDDGGFRREEAEGSMSKWLENRCKDPKLRECDVFGELEEVHSGLGAVYKPGREWGGQREQHGPGRGESWKLHPSSFPFLASYSTSLPRGFPFFQILASSNLGANFFLSLWLPPNYCPITFLSWLDF